MSWIGAAIGALGSLYSSRKANKQARNQRRRDMELAEQYGIHPLSAWGTAGTPMGDGGYGMMASGFDKIGQAAAQRKRAEREDEVMNDQMLRQIIIQSKNPQFQQQLLKDQFGITIPDQKNSTRDDATLSGTINPVIQNLGKGIKAADKAVGNAAHKVHLKPGSVWNRSDFEKERGIYLPNL